MKNFMRIVLSGLFVLLHLAKADASVLFAAADNQASFSIEARSGWVIQDYRPTWRDATQFAAMPFMLSQQSYVTGVEMALTSPSGWSGNYSVEILDTASGLPDVSSVLWTALSKQSAPIQAGFRDYAITTATGDAALLEADTRYWLYLSCSAPCSLAWWSDSSNPAPGAIQYNSNYPYDLRWTISESNAAMFRVTGDVAPVPAPPTFILMLTGLGIISLRKRLKKNA
jgi:hypothetical protein